MQRRSTPLNPWPIAIIAFFAVFITGIIAFASFAARNKVDLVRADYYEEEVRYQSRIDREQRTRALGTKVDIAFDNAKREICISVPVPSPIQHDKERMTNESKKLDDIRPLPLGEGRGEGTVSGQIHFYRPSDASLDRNVKLTLDANHRQRIDANNLTPGFWKVRVEWNSEGQDYSFDQSILIPNNP